jgi:hypothetical protein
MKIQKDYKVGIITGLIASALFLYFLDPILKFIGTLVFNVFSHVSSAYLDRLFAKAALGVAPEPSLLIFGVMIGIFTGVVATTIFSLRGKNQDDEEPGEKPKRHFRGLRLALSLFMGVMVLVNFHYFWGTWFQFKLVTSFDQHIRAVAPYMNDHDEKLLKSRWTQMKSRRDYDKIYEDLRQIAATNNITLPDNLIYCINDF